MGVYTRKTWTDSVIEAANRAETEEEKMLRGMIEIVMVLRDSSRLKDQERFYTGNFDLTTKEGFREFDQHRRINALMHNFTRHLENIFGESICFFWDLRANKDRPYLKLIPDPEKQIFRDLIQNLQDPDWIAALRWCAELECLKLILSNSKWANKFCSKKCKEKYHGRKNKKNGREKRETIEWKQVPKIVECPGNLDELMDVIVTETECINPNGRNIRNLFEKCSVCKHIKGNQLEEKEE